MTNKDLSRELCEICGIERKGKLVFKKRNWDGKTYVCAGRGYKEFDFCSTPEATVDIIPTKDYKQTNGFHYPYSDIERIKKEYDKNGYDFVEFRQRTIDFTQPENFVKLEEIMLAELAKQRLTVVKYVYYYSDNTLIHEYILITKCGHKFKFTHNGIKVDNWFVEREDRTECLILFILWKVLPVCGESIKLAIKSEVWKYE